MTPEEFKAWQEVTELSKSRWVIDAITRINRGEYLFYKGGRDGTFIRVNSDGEVWLGYYKDAIPHIGDAFFEIKHRKTLGADANEACARVIERMGIPALLTLVEL
jgi:hypothetical protein